MTRTMILQAIDTLYIAADPAPYERLGLRPRPFALGPPTFQVGNSANAVGLAFALPNAMPPLGDNPRLNQGLFAIGIRVADVPKAVSHLTSHGIATTASHNGAWLPVRDRAGTDIAIYAGAWSRDSDPGHTFPLKRLDHLAAIVRDLDRGCRFWTDVLNVPVTGEVRTPTMIIRQLRIGDAIFELLGAAGPDSPIHQRAAGLISMAAWEVADLPAAISQSRAAGFTAPDAAIGVLPGTRTATIPAPELGGMAMQLLQYD